MIGAIRGTLIDKTTSKILIETTGGVFYEVFISEQLLIKLPEQNSNIILYTSMIVREQEMYLVGFLSQGEKNLFEILITAKGIGPKQGMKILGDISGSDLRSAIVSGNTSMLTKIKGISSKKAEQLILDLREKMQKNIGDLTQVEDSFDPSFKQKTELLLTMRALGYTDLEIKKPIEQFFETQDISGKSVEQLVTEFLAVMKKASL